MNKGDIFYDLSTNYQFLFCPLVLCVYTHFLGPCDVMYLTICCGHITRDCPTVIFMDLFQNKLESSEGIQRTSLFVFSWSLKDGGWVPTPETTSPLPPFAFCLAALSALHPFSVCEPHRWAPNTYVCWCAALLVIVKTVLSALTVPPTFSHRFRVQPISAVLSVPVVSIGTPDNEGYIFRPRVVWDRVWPRVKCWSHLEVKVTAFVNAKNVWRLKFVEMVVWTWKLAHMIEGHKGEISRPLTPIKRSKKF